MAKAASKVWRKHGALDYKECRIEDPKPKFVTLTFPQLTKVKPTEDVWFSYITFKSRKHRDAVNKKVMAEFEKYMEEQKKKGKEQQMPFDVKRMAYAGFKVEVSA